MVANSGFCAGVISLFLCRPSAHGPAFASASLRARNWLGNACVIGFRVCLTLLLLLGNLSIYDEAIIGDLPYRSARFFSLFARDRPRVVP